LLDAELTAMAGESYSRAYGVSLHVVTFEATLVLFLEWTLEDSQATENMLVSWGQQIL
jgi:hypothetical protein